MIQLKETQIFKWESKVIDVINVNIPTYNFGLSHGVASIIIFLSRILKSGVTNEKVIEMLSGAVNYVLLQQIDYLQYSSFFPGYLLKNTPNTITKSRLAWCYGDLGVGIALWQAGKALKKTAWKKTGLAVLLQSTKRRDLVENYVHDAGICHGSSGIALIFRRMFLETNQNEFAEAAQYWLNQTLQFSTFGDGLAGYKTFIPNEWECDYSLLTGISGIGLVFTSYLLDDKQDWDEMFLLS